MDQKIFENFSECGKKAAMHIELCKKVSSKIRGVLLKCNINTAKWSNDDYNNFFISQYIENRCFSWKLAQVKGAEDFYNDWSTAINCDKIFNSWFSGMVGKNDF